MNKAFSNEQTPENIASVRAREVESEEREKLWQAISKVNSDYEHYRTWTARRIPVVVLERN